MATQRPQWPHTVEDIETSLDGIWGLVGATDKTGNILRLERSLHQPVTYTLVAFAGSDESKVMDKKSYTAEERPAAIKEFALALGFTESDFKNN